MISPARAKGIISELEGLHGIPETDLEYSNIYELTIAVVLSAQTTDKQVNRVTGTLFSKYKNFSELAEAKISAVEKIIKSTGFYHTKTLNIINLSKEVSERYSGKLPGTLEELIKLPGVGRKTANVILSVGFGIPALAVDTHVARIAARLGFSESSNPEKIEKDICSLLPPQLWTKTHLIFIRHGRTLCKARNPECGECPVKKKCHYFNKNSSL